MFQRLAPLCFLAALLLSAVMPGCAPVQVRQTTLQETYSKVVQEDVISTGELNPLTEQVLRMQWLPTARQEPARAFQDLERQYRTAPDNTIALALVELALWQARQQEALNPTGAADWYLLAAARSYEFLFTAPPGTTLFDLRYDRLQLFYQRAVAGFLQQVQRSHGNFAAHQRTVLGESYEVTIPSGPGFFDPQAFDELLLAAEMAFEGLTNRHRRFGLGLALVGFRKNPRAAPADRFFPRVGTSHAVTGLLRFDPSGNGQSPQRVAQLCFYDALQVEAIEMNGLRVPLMADFTAPFGLLISRTRLKNIGLAETLRSEAWLEEAGFYMTEPFDPHKIPLITVHGLLSSPVAWINLQNDLMSDPVLRQHYQIWHFSYPPGLPIAVSAQLFREKLEEIFAFFDPQHAYPALAASVVMAHSMGGLLSKTVVSDSEDRLWRRVFQKGPDDIELSTEARQQLDRVLRFHRYPFITRIVFLAVPHRGSLLAESLAGKIGRLLIAVPQSVLLPLRFILAQAALAPDIKEYLQEDPTSIKALSPRNPFLQVLAEIAIDRGVPFHSIIGDRGLGNGVQGSDGVVPYTSAHLEGAESEVIVPTDHSGAHTHPLAVREVRRILHLHLQR